MNQVQPKTIQQQAAEALAAAEVVPGNGIDTSSYLKLSAEQQALIDAAILADFDGTNHSELACRYRVTLRKVYQLVKHSLRQSVSLALHRVADSEAEVIWASSLHSAEPLRLLEAGLEAFQKAKARLQAEAHDPAGLLLSHRLLVAIAVLPAGHPAVLAASNRGPAASAPAETPPGTQVPAGDPPVPEPVP